MIQRESWHKEADSMEQQLQSLLRQLNQGQISPVEYAKIVLRMHGYEGKENLLFRDEENRGRLLITQTWLDAHRHEVQEILDLAGEVMKVAQDAHWRSPWIEELALAIERRWGTNSPFINSSSFTEMYEILLESFRPGMRAFFFHPVIGGYGILLGRDPTQEVYSEEQFNGSVQGVLDYLRELVQMARTLTASIEDPRGESEE